MAAKETHPSRYAASSEYPNNGATGFESASEVDPRAVKCAQCGFPYADYSQIETCFVCGTDNIQGQRFGI
jgi:rubrerythrin